MSTSPAPLFKRLRMVLLAGLFVLISLGSLRGQSTEFQLERHIERSARICRSERSFDINRRCHWGDSRGRCRF